jgi:transposase
MAGDEALLEALGDWSGFEVAAIERKPGDPEEIWITLRRKAGARLYCGACGREATRVHEQQTRVVRDLPLFDAHTYLRIETCRVWCDQCGGPKRLRIDWLDEQQRVTRRLAESILNLCSHVAISHIARFFGVHWHTVKRLDKRRLQARFSTLDVSDVRVIGVDEFALHKGHRYATVVVEPSRRRVLWVGKGRDRRSFRRFFKELGTAGCARIEAVVMDQSATYELEVRRHCPQAEIVFDLFHIVVKYGREVIDRVRVDEANRLREQRSARQVVKSARWLLLRNRDSLKSPAQQVQLDELLAANQALMTVYILRDDLKQLWRYRHRGYARRAWEGWYRRAMDSGIHALQVFADRLKPYLHGILAHTRWPLHTSLIEGINNRIKVIKRTAYGFRDDEYFFLKIKAAFPG